jgi:hypothetical protein
MPSGRSHDTANDAMSFVEPLTPDDARPSSDVVDIPRG